MEAILRSKLHSDCFIKHMLLGRLGGYCDYFHLLSGQDYPVRSNKEFDEFFEKNNGKSFMNFDSKEQCADWRKKKYPSRIRPWYIQDLPHRDNKLIDFFVRGFDFISRKIWWRRLIPNVWGGWNWFTWHRKVASYVINQEETNPKFFKRFHHTNCADELIFHTLLYPHLDELNIDIEHQGLRYINWHKWVEGRRHLGSPLTLNEEEYNDIINSDSFFCRKIDPLVSKSLKNMLKQNIRKA